jgi:aspartate/methionine/tyrosine aminotransferase
MFSERTAWDLGENDWSRAVRRARAEGRELVDLTVSNPTQCGFAYPADLLLPLADPRAAEYEPDPLGMRGAREAVVRYYAEHEAAVDAAHIVMTTSTSEAYSFLFRLLCDPGDEVLIAQPSYPLFDYIARLDSVHLRQYPIHYDPGAAQGGPHAWGIDFAALRAQVNERTRAVIVVHPNNPTGTFVSDGERAELMRLCAQHGLALIVDEVFLDYALEGVRIRSFATGEAEGLTFVLSGLSKVCGLPQMKASWIVCRGPEALAADAMARLEMIADTFLSMNAPVQFAMGEWLDVREHVQRQIRSRVAENLRVLDERLRGTSADRLALEGGWTAVLRVPRAVDGVDFAYAALQRGVLVQPGEFYGLPAGRVVVSLLTDSAVWREGVALLPV